MEIFVDSCDISLIRELKKIGLVQGITTNPSLIAAAQIDINKFIEEVSLILEDNISIQVISNSYYAMLEEALNLAQINSKIVVKLPLTYDGLKVCYQLREKDIRTNLTLCFSPSQALIAAKAGASYISLFIGRMDDVGHFGIDLVGECVAMFENYPEIHSQILVASIRNPIHIIESAKLGADVVTVSPEILFKMIEHPLTEKGLEKFLNDSRKFK